MPWSPYDLEKPLIFGASPYKIASFMSALTVALDESLMLSCQDKKCDFQTARMCRAASLAGIVAEGTRFFRSSLALLDELALSGERWPLYCL